MILKLQVLALSLLFGMMAISISYGMSPEEYAKQEGANPNLISELSDACKTADNPEHCFGIGLSISKAESQMGNDPKARSHGYFGRVGSKDKSAYGFVDTYKRKYYIVDKYNEGGMFYGYGPNNKAPTSYCMSEDSSNSKGHCPRGRASFNSIYGPYKKLVMNKNTEPELIKTVANKINPEGVKIKKICKIVYRAEYDGYVQVDSYIGQFINWIRGVKKDSKIFYCRDIK